MIKYHLNLRKNTYELVTGPQNIAIEFVYRQKIMNQSNYGL